MSVATALKGMDGLLDAPGIPEFNPMMLLHGEQRIEINRPIPPGSRIKAESKISDVADKRSGAVVTLEVKQTDVKTGELYTTNYSKIFIRGIGGFGDKGILKDPPMPAIPKRTADHVAEEITDKNQALIYRLCGDPNPLHVDPNMSAMGGFEMPILHGLCSYGFSARAIYEKYCGNDPKRFKAMNARFTSHVFPGETLVVEMFKEGGQIIFQTKTKERGKAVVVGTVDIAPAAKL